MGFTWLRVSVWFVVVTAVVGNLAVLLVLLSNVFDLTVPKFLMCHLAFADLCMGAYLLILAVMDVHSSGVYFNFAYGWQIGKWARRHLPSVLRPIFFLYENIGTRCHHVCVMSEAFSSKLRECNTNMGSALNSEVRVSLAPLPVQLCRM
jgi:hypothetical protein